MLAVKLWQITSYNVKMNTMNINILCVAINVKPAVAAVQEDMPQIEPACFGAMSRGFADEPKA